MLVHIDSLEKREKELEKKINDRLNLAKIKLKEGDKKAAKLHLNKKKNYEKFLETLENTHNVLEQQIFSIKTAENNASVTDVLKKCLEAEKQIGMDPDKFADVANDLKDAKESMEEINSGMKEFAEENDEDELNQEMEKLELESKKEQDFEFPSANKEKIDDNDY